MVLSHKIVFRCHRPRTPLARSQSLLGSWLEEDHHYIRAARGDREGGERRTTAAPVYCRGGVAICGAREVRERSIRRDLAGAQWGDGLTLDCGCMDKSGEHESEGRRSKPNHDRRGETDERRCTDRTVCKYHDLYRMRERLWASSGYDSFLIFGKNEVTMLR